MTPPPRLAAVALAWVLLAAGALAGQEPPPSEPAPEPPAASKEGAEPDAPAGADAETAEQADDDDSGGGRTVLKIEVDLDSLVTVGIDAPVALTAGEVLTVEVDPGAIRVQAAVADVPEARTFVDVTVAAGGRERLRLKMEKALEDHRKLEARDRTFRDIETRLMWPTQDNGADVTWAEAAEYCDELGHGGWKDWRLPTLAELEGIEAMWSLRSFKTADPINLTSCCPWSSDQIDDENAWNFNFRYRRPFRGHLSYSLDLRALCVRDGSDEIPENTRRNRRLAKREAKEKHREKLRRQAEKAAAEEAAAAAEREDGKTDGAADGAKEDPDGDSGGDLEGV